MPPKRKRKHLKRDRAVEQITLAVLKPASFQEKLYNIFLPYVIITVAFLAVYSCLHWLLVLQWNLFDPHVFFSHWLFPIVLSIPIYKQLLYKRVGLLLLSKQSQALGVLFAWLLLAANAITCQYFVADLAGSVAELTTPFEVPDHPSAKYYLIREHRVNKEQIRTGDFVTKKGGKRRRAYTVFTFVICAPLETAQQKSIAGGDIWIRKLYDTTFGQQQPANGQAFAEKQFKEACLQSFHAENQDEFVYLRRPDKGEDWEKPYEATGFSPESPAELPLILDPVNAPFNTRYERSAVILCILSLPSLLALFMLFTRGEIDPAAWQQFKADKANRKRSRLNN
ncbi:hypothetical protein [Paraflavitalea pollutisoli]|uniref:hypothetical protein n=1 Tax=Paraflavitalea pollutisoli TaxID=3034143 RepID=UPI0023ED623E|nr:hypothetical protein [Paraflavitalea sp. H1-2-19X]